MLVTAGINRRPTPWDRENYNVWKSWNFSEEMILEAAKLSSGKSSPTAYMNGILSNWKNNETFTLDALADKPNESDSQEEYNREYERRRTLAVSRAQKNTEKAMELDGFSAVYGRLNSIEKDLAFAEIAGNSENLKKLENEQADLYKNANEILSAIGITLDDLTPRYACVKCNDTGYVGTHRCDCYKK
jgi:rubrerythrin